MNLYLNLFAGHNTDGIGKIHQYFVRIVTRVWSFFGPSCTACLQTLEVHLKLNKI